MNLSAPHRMNEADFPCVQAYSGVGIGSGCAILEVSLYRASHSRELAAYLVMASREQLYFQKVISVCVPQIAVVQLCEFGSGI